ncbi:MAG: ATP phosphoribosyltransferase regulatory subunit [Rhodospirillaceae bacterium]|nr:ATP phosphoribosyltransferase regulatory subunit [Rhodospirillaceae bacterium]
MTEAKTPALLPTGLRDLLPPEAGAEAALAESLLACFAAQGYERVKPPLVEFEESMLSGAGAGLADQTFRLMDPASHRMMAVRSDLTPQIARIAASRLSRSPRPLRLSYAGEILRVRGGELRPERQFRQVGFELIGIGAGAACDAEVILLAADALRGLGLEGGLSVDLNAPTLVASLIAEAGLDAEPAGRLRDALDRKDAAAVEGAGGAVAAQLVRLLRATGAAETALDSLAQLSLPGGAAAALAHLLEVATLLREAAPELALTVDPIEWRGFEYHSGTSFSLFAGGVRTELGRGGRYSVGGAGSEAEEAAGCTIYVDTVLRAAPAPPAPRCVYLPHGTPRADGAGLRDAGWTTIAGLAPEGDPAAEAARLGCSHLWQGGAARALAERED